VACGLYVGWQSERLSRQLAPRFDAKFAAAKRRYECIGIIHQRDEFHEHEISSGTP